MTQPVSNQRDIDARCHEVTPAGGFCGVPPRLAYRRSDHTSRCPEPRRRSKKALHYGQLTIKS